MDPLKLLRDPIWQMLGVIVAVVTLVLTLPQFSISKGDLIVLPIRKSSVVDRWIPRDSLKLLIDGANVDSDSAIATSYLIINESGSSISPDDYNGPIQVQASPETRLIRVDSCANSFGQACTSDGTRTPSGGAYVDTSWKKDGDSWVAKGPLLNKDDVACVQIVAQSTNSAIRDIKPPRISAHIRGVNLKFFATPEQYFESRKAWHDVFQTSVYLDGFQPHALVLIAAALMFASARLFAYASTAPLSSTIGATLLVFLMLLSVSTAEILVSLYLKGRNTVPIHPIVWPLLGLHALAVTLLVWRGRKRLAEPEDAAQRAA